MQGGTVNHTFAGCRLLLEHFHGEDGFRNLTCELLVYAVGAHHGLFDCIDESGKSGFLHRLEKQEIGYEESCTQFLQPYLNHVEEKLRQFPQETEIQRARSRISELCRAAANKSGVFIG